MIGRVDRAHASHIAHSHHPIAAPVAPDRMRALVGRLTPVAGGRALDVGCGQGEWLLALLEAQVGLAGVGVDISAAGLEEAERGAGRRGLSQRTSWQQGDAATWHDGLFDVVLCVGATHAFGDLGQALDGVRRHLRPGGQVLFGDGIWDAPPTEAALEALQASTGEFPDLSGLLQRVRDHGFEPGYGHVSTLEEWDDYELSWTGSLTQWALQEASCEQDRVQALEIAQSHRNAWLDGYRGQLGFATVVLYDLPVSPV